MQSAAWTRWLPHRFPALGGGTQRRLRAALLALLALAALIQLAGYGYVLFDAYRLNPEWRAVGLRTELDDAVLIHPVRRDTIAAGIRPGARLVAIDGHRFAPDAAEIALARRLFAGGPIVRLAARNPDGRVVTATVRRQPGAPLAVAANPVSLDVRMGIRLASTLLCSLSLFAATAVLLLRRSEEVEAMLFAAAFLVIAAALDPPLLLWGALGLGWAVSWLTGLWWALLVIALAAFPDGRFAPRWLRWTIPAAPVLGVVLAVDRLGDWSTLGIGVLVPLALLALQLRRYRRLASELERQQIKWAAFGFAVAFVLIAVSVVAAMADTSGWRPVPATLWLLVVICLFNIGIAVLPLGLLVALMRYRLWDVDAVLSRSAALTALAAVIGLTWAASADLAKAATAWLLGKEHDVLALAIGAVLATGVFAPTQAWVLAWSKRRFTPARASLETLPRRLEAWGEECDLPRLALRVLDVAMRGVHARGGAILVRTPAGPIVAASEGMAAPETLAAAAPAGLADDPRVSRLFDLGDAEGVIGWLALAARSDDARYTRADLHTLERVLPAVAAALRRAEAREQRATPMYALLGEMQARLARLEQGGARPA